MKAAFAPKWRRGGALALLALFLCVWFGFLEMRGLFFPDEGRYAEIPNEMLATGDWVTPRINGFPYFEKPPLQYWMIAATYAVAGTDEWSARFPPALVGLAGVLAVLLTARRLFSRRAGWMAAAVLASSAGYFVSSQFLTLDMTLSGLLTGALCAFLLAQSPRAPPSACRRWMLVAWTLCALAVLTKGIIGVLLPMLAIVTYVLWRREFTLLARLHIVAGLLLFLAVAAPWFILVEMRNPGFAEFFFIREHWQRFTQPEHNRPGPWWYYLPIGLAYLMPWLPALAASATHRLRRIAVSPAKTHAFDARAFCWCWAGAIFLFFSVSSSKLPAYLMPMMGAIALAVAGPLARRWGATVRITAWTLVAGGVLGAVGMVPALRYIRPTALQLAFAEHVGWLFAGMLALVVAGAGALWLIRARRRLPALATIVIGGIVGLQVCVVATYKVDTYFSAERTLEVLTGGEQNRPFRPDAPFYSIDSFDAAVPFYLGRLVTLVRERGELAFGIEVAPQNHIGHIEEFFHRWYGHDEAYAIMPPATYAWFVEIRLPMRVVVADGRRVVVARR